MEFKSPKEFIDVIDKIKNVSTTLTFYFENETILIQAKDDSLISVLEVSFDKNGFIWKAKQDGNITVVTKQLLEILAFFRKSITMEWVFTEDTINIKDEEGDFTLNAILAEDDSRFDLGMLQNTDYSYSLDTRIWKDRCKKVVKYAPNITLHLRENYFVMEFKNEMTRGRLKTMVDDRNQTHLKDHSFDISLTHLCNVEWPDVEKTTFTTSENKPMTMIWETNLYKIVYTVAPRIQD